MLNHFEFVGSNTFQKSWDRETKPCRCKCRTQISGVKSQTQSNNPEKIKSESQDAKSQNSSNTIGSTGNKVKNHTAYSGNASKKDLDNIYKNSAQYREQQLPK